jgi:hypothetical protein
MRLITLSIILAFSLIGCGDSSGGDAGTGGSDAKVVTLSHTYDALSLDVASEISGTCQTWVLGNEEPLYVTRVRQTNDGGWHHSNWFFVPEEVYRPNPEAEGPDATIEGTWPCRDRNFREYIAAAAGGVFFAQSTQALGEQQAFPAGAALEIPPHSAIVGSVHLLNISASRMESAMTMEVDTIARDEVEIRLTPFSFSNTSLEIPPAVDGVPTESRFSMTCDLTDVFEQNFGTVPTYNVYYVLAHYHEWGNFFNLSFTHEDGSRETILELENRVGEPIGKTIDPPMSNKGAKSITVDCGYINNTDRTLEYGLGGQEMCVFLAYTDSNLKVGASGDTNHKMGQDENGIHLNETDCGPITGFKAYNDEF